MMPYPITAEQVRRVLLALAADGILDDWRDPLVGGRVTARKSLTHCVA